ncbi:PucR family transcriptional regulator [Mycobacterium sp. SMC-4]|uniref:PucR family transcriptional regulator n=1 Tax=Mycobacterium sp. SMC-4 TaxID=2857059 RepID=UPI003D0689BD
MSTASLGLRVLAGSGGLDRTVLWAHVCELAEPTESLGPGEILMTVGVSIPTPPDAQVQFIQRLDDAGLAGVILGDQAMLPPISPEMLQAGNDRSFPILISPATGFFTAIARHVASANSSSRIEEVSKLGKLYHLAASAGDDASAFLDKAAVLLRVEMQILDGTTQLEILSSSTSQQPSTTSAMRQRSYPLNGLQPATLLLREHPGEELESLILTSLLKILEVLVDRMLDRADSRQEASAKLMSALLNGFGGQVGLQASRFLGVQNQSTDFVVAAFPRDAAAVVARAVAIKRIPALVGTGRSTELALIPVEAIPDFRSLIEMLGVSVGVSSTFFDYIDTRSASDEATRVLTANHGLQNWAEYEGTTISVLARSHREASNIVNGVLGPLTRSDPRTDELRETLFTFLRNDRRWTDTASELAVHRQTVAYRLKSIQDLIGVDLSRTADIASLWIAYQAWMLLNPKYQAPGIGRADA